MAYYLIRVDKDVICDAIKFLILNTQQPDGMFKEVGYVYSQSMRVSFLILIKKYLLNLVVYKNEMFTFVYVYV